MNVLVTGAGSGIGKATACLLAERDFRVAVTDLDEQAAQKVADGARQLRHEVGRYEQRIGP